MAADGCSAIAEWWSSSPAWETFLSFRVIKLFYFIFIWRAASKWVLQALFLIRQHAKVAVEGQGSFQHASSAAKHKYHLFCRQWRTCRACLSVPTARQGELFRNWWKRNCRDFWERERERAGFEFMCELKIYLCVCRDPTFLRSGEPGVTRFISCYRIRAVRPLCPTFQRHPFQS